MREKAATGAEDRRESTGGSAFADLRRFVPRSSHAGGVEAGRCEMCSAAIGPEHRHLLDPGSGKLICACGACSVLFGSRGETQYKLVPRRTRALRNFELSDAQWDGLLMPINMAFFLNSTPRGRMTAIYPSPAGPTESQLPLDQWADLVAQNAVLADLQPDVEALLVNRLGAMRGFAEHEYYIVPIDVCYRLVGILRGQWRGFSGGAEMWSGMTRFFDDLKRRATAVEASHA